MYQRKESGKNTYYPSFLCMEVDTPGNILKVLLMLLSLLCISRVGIDVHAK